MKLLIVDDQLLTLNAISQEIDWAGEGITEVATAQNAMEARLVFKQGVPQIMICDIEMPVENGIELCRWVREMAYGTRIIFLTCHSNFTYAKEAIELKAIDYILQPAPYEEIARVVRKTVMEIKESDKRQEEFKKNRDYAGKYEYIRRNLWRDYLLERSSRDNLPDTVARLHKDKEITLVLLQYVGWREPREQWADRLLFDIVASFTSDIFPPDRYRTVMIQMDRDICALLIQMAGTETELEDGLYKQLKYLCDVFEVHMPCGAACYPAQGPVDGLPMVWKELLKLKDSNVVGRSGLFTGSASASVKIRDFRDTVSQWKHYLCLGDGEQMESEAAGLLDGIAAGGELDAQNLMHFYQEFMQMLYQAGEEECGLAVAGLFRSEEEMELYRNGMKSMKQMLRLIHHVAVRYQADDRPSVRTGPVERIKRYIMSHLDQNITKDEITRVIHLNADYVTRLFKKETGMSIKSYIIQQKMLEARNLLRNTTLSVSHIAVRLGYTNFSHFSVTYKKQFGISPMEEKRSSE